MRLTLFQPARESDNLTGVKEISATDAARGFSALLTSVEKEGETFFVTRGGRVIARIEPAAGTSGAAVKALLAHFRPDPGWAADLGEVRELLATQEREWPA
jgi:antitoxin (DNA-binding transcriptional repressor) of toxin-antitoxin stability system